MNNYNNYKKVAAEFRQYLIREEKAVGTVDKYVRDVTVFVFWLGNNEITKEVVTEYKNTLLQAGKKAVTVNNIMAAVNCFLSFLGCAESKVKYFKVQKRIFRDKSRELTKQEYEKLVETAKKHNKHRLALLIETICATGVRVSEVQYITVENAKKRRADIYLKGKIRTILIPNKLARKLLKYAQKQKILSGEIFITKEGNGLSRKQIWAEMKSLCKKAGVDGTKVFPHNLRHLFARIYYQSCKDVVKLADILGHSSVETTRIYLIGTGEEHARSLEHLGLVS